MFSKRVTFLVGHFGSGKSEIALNGALDLAARGEAVTLADLDIVKPYFRSRSARSALADAGVRLLAPTGDNTHADLPIIVPHVRQALRDPGCRLIADLGGDDSGARVLGSFADVMPVEESHCLAVLNFRRPSTPTPAAAVAMVRAIEASSRTKVTGLVANTHLLDETTVGLVLEGGRMATEVAEVLGLPLVAVTVAEEIAGEIAGSELGAPLVRLRRLLRKPFEAPAGRTTGPLFAVS